jgi:hypothetical protein
MYFYEFNNNDFENYALIGAETKDKAVEFYKDHIDENVSIFQKPTLVTEQYTKVEIAKALVDFEDEKKIFYDNYKKNIQNKETFLVLIMDA